MPAPEPGSIPPAAAADSALPEDQPGPVSYPDQVEDSGLPEDALDDDGSAVPV